jgi:5'-methylthioadenosine phosphorylase
MDPPRPRGDRLALIYGHSLPEGTEPVSGEAVRVDAGAERPVAAVDAGEVVALARHGAERFLPAHLVEHRANLRALCELGCGRVLAIGSAGTLRTDWPVGTLVCPDDFLAPGIAPSCYDDARGHRAPGFDPGWRERVLDAWPTDPPLIDGGTYAHVHGPRFETPAEVRMLARDADLVGMTIAAEAILAREVGLAYAAVCTIDNVANGLEAEPLTIERYREGRDRTAPVLLRALEGALVELAR